MQNKLMKLEIAGIFFTILMSVFLQNLYALCHREIIGVIFGSVNDSIWEIAKTVLFSYLLWGVIEMLAIRMPFKRFVASKVLSLYFLGISYILTCLVFSGFDSTAHSLSDFTSVIICTGLASFLTFRLMFSRFEIQNLFAISFFLLLLFGAMYCSFTPFPPHCFIFMDRTNGLYGIIPEYLDSGAIALDTLYYI